MNIRTFLRTRMTELGIRRRDIPRILRATNANTALRSFDDLMMGYAFDDSFLATLRASDLVGHDHVGDFDAARATTLHRLRVDADEAVRAAAMRARRDVVPHVWVEHERWYPQPVFVVAWFGVEPFKKLDLPSAVLAADHPADVLLAVAAYLRCVRQDPAAAVLMKGPFGRATHFYFRTTYDEYYVFSIAEQCFVERREGRPAVGNASLLQFL